MDPKDLKKTLLTAGALLAAGTGMAQSTGGNVEVKQAIVISVDGQTGEKIVSDLNSGDLHKTLPDGSSAGIGETVTVRLEEVAPNYKVARIEDGGGSFFGIFHS